MFKKVTLPIIIIFIFLQLAVPAGMITYREISDFQLHKFGDEYKFRIVINSIDEGGVVYSLSATNKNSFYERGKYGVLKTNEDGFSEITEIVTEKPKTGTYIISNNNNSFEFGSSMYVPENPLSGERAQQLNEKYADPEHFYDYYLSDRFQKLRDAYITVKVYKGRTEVSGMYLGGEKL